jgi:hypothetical protein
MPNQVISQPTTGLSESVVNFSTGKLVGDAGTPAAYQLPVGFVPRYFRLVCIASSVANNVGREIEWFDGMADGAALVTTLTTGSGSAASKAISATLGPTVVGANPNQGNLNYVLIPAGAFDASATYVYQIQA